MDNLEKYKGVIPAFYACYDEQGNISPETSQKIDGISDRQRGLKEYMLTGSSGECIYQSVEERKTVIENVMEVARGQDNRHKSCRLQ